MTFEEEFRDYFYNHSFKDIYFYYRNNYNLSRSKVDELISQYNLHKTKEDTLRLRFRTNMEKNGCLGKKHKTIPYEELYDMYVTQNLTIQEISDKLNHNFSKDLISKLLKEYSITKSKELDREHRRKVSLEKYGTEHPRQSNIVKDKQKATNLKRYGVENASQNTEINAKRKQTCLKKYGVENAFQNILVRKKQKQTCIERYGVENVFQSEEIKDKMRKTFQEKYGVSWSCYSDKIKEKSRKTWESVDRDILREKKKQTCLERYGVIAPYQVEDIKQKGINTTLEKYGVENIFLLPDLKYNIKRKDSKPNLIFKELLNKNNIIINDDSDREFVIKNRSYDFKVGNNLIEINPTATHNVTWSAFGSSNSIDSNYHYNKTILAKENGCRCIHIWDWDNRDKIINLLLPKEHKVYARNCIITTVSSKECNKFLNQYHLQNTCKQQTIRLGLYYNNELIEVMTFGKPRYNKKYEYELLRLCTKSNYLVVGGTERLFSYFKKIYQPSSIISYCDNSKFNGEVYSRLGFTLKEYGVPSKHWYNIKTGKHITDNLLRQQGFDRLLGKEYGCYGKGTSNEELMLKHNFVEIYDSGQSVYTYKVK